MKTEAIVTVIGVLLFISLMIWLSSYTSYESSKIREGKAIYESYDKDFPKAFAELENVKEVNQDEWWIWKQKEDKAKELMMERKTEESTKKYKEYKEKAKEFWDKKTAAEDKLRALEYYFDKHYNLK